MDSYGLKNLCDLGEYGQVVSYWKPEQADEYTQWDYLYFMNSFYKLRRYEDCLKVYRACVKRHPPLEQANAVMAWSLYYARIRDFDFAQGDASALRKQVDFIFEHCPDPGFSLRWVLVKFMVDAINAGKLGKIPDQKLVLHYLDLVDPANLSARSQKLTDKDGKPVAGSSDQERWYTEKTKALQSLQEYAACVDCCDEALRRIDETPPENAGWFLHKIVYRKAKCLQALGRNAEALGCLDQMPAGNAKWELMFELERDSGHAEAALRAAANAGFSDNVHRMRASLYDELADYLVGIGRREEAMLHRRFVVLLFQENGWRPRQRHASWRFEREIEAMKRDEVLERLLAIWSEMQAGTFLTEVERACVPEQRRVGTIRRCFPEKRYGFVETDDHISCYFPFAELRGKSLTPTTGARVRFSFIEKTDPKANAPTYAANELSFI